MGSGSGVRRSRGVSLVFVVCPVPTQQRKDEKENFIMAQFLEYLEEINMAPFNGWNKKDFEAFLNIEDDHERMLRLRVKEKLNQYLKELKELLTQEKLFTELIQTVGNIKKDSDHAWGVLCKPPVGRKVHVPHFNWWINSDEFGMGIQIEGKTPSYETKAKISEDKEAFLDILKGLKGFDLVIREGEKRSDRPRDFQAFNRVKITIDDTTSIRDVEYVLDKMGKYNFFEIHLGKTFKRDEEIINKPDFLNKSIDIMKKMTRYYKYTTTSTRVKGRMGSDLKIEIDVVHKKVGPLSRTRMAQRA